MRDNLEDQPYFHISIVSEMLSIHPQTVRNYERKGLLEPSRTQGNMRLFSQADVERIRRIHTYTNIGVNLAGVEIIMKLLDQMDEMREQLFEEFERTRRETREEMEKEIEEMRERGQGTGDQGPGK
jgi:MerR family transcriptional regulator, heat shock protein HspR